MSFSESSEGLFSLPCTKNEPRASAGVVAGKRGWHHVSEHQQQADSEQIRGLHHTDCARPSGPAWACKAGCSSALAAGADRGGRKLLTVLYALGLARAVRLPVALALSDSRGCSLVRLLVVLGLQGGSTSRLLYAMSWAVSWAGAPSQLRTSLVYIGPGGAALQPAGAGGPNSSRTRSGLVATLCPESTPPRRVLPASAARLDGQHQLFLTPGV
jgi:hypothetical protein